MPSQSPHSKRRSVQQRSDPVDDAANNVQVLLRIRPLLPSEMERGETANASVLPDGRTVMITAQPAGHGRKLESQQHKLDRVLGPSVSQLEFFHQSGVESYCDSALEGMSNTVFCFGQTGSGKTYTMTGPILEQDELTDHAGLQFRAAHYMSRMADEINEALGSEPGFTPVVLRASYVEIYNEAINDLLNDTTNLKARWSQSSQSFYIENLMMVQCDSPADFVAVLTEGSNHRKRASHKLNVDSSRSHIIFTVYVERRDSPAAPARLGKINFVDLAGSEKLKDSESAGVNTDETKNINKSLFALGNVISSLAKGGRGDSFVPYRDSTLTKLLMDSLGGNSRTLMVACVTPSNRFTEESLRTISYALRTKNIVNANPTVRIDPKQQQLYELRVELDMLRKENTTLKQQLAAARQSSGSPASSSTPVMPHLPKLPGVGIVSPVSTAPSAVLSLASLQRVGGASEPNLLSPSSSLLNATQGSFGASPYNLQLPPGTAQSSVSAPAALYHVPGSVSASSPSGSASFLGMHNPHSAQHHSHQSFLLPQSSHSFVGTNNWTTSSVRSLPSLPTAASVISVHGGSLSAHQQASLDVAIKVQKDNEELRKEIAQLRNMILSMKVESKEPSGGVLSASPPATAGFWKQPLPSTSTSEQRSRMFRGGESATAPYSSGGHSSAASLDEGEGSPTYAERLPGRSHVSVNDAGAPVGGDHTRDLGPTSGASQASQLPAASSPLTEFGFRPAPKKVQKLVFPSC